MAIQTSEDHPLGGGYVYRGSRYHQCIRITMSYSYLSFIASIVCRVSLLIAKRKTKTNFEEKLTSIEEKNINLYRTTLHTPYPNQMSDPNKKLEQLSLQFSNHQQSLNDLITSRSTLETQLQENKIVEQELAELSTSTDKIYKLTGPVLLPQEFHEAKLNVDKRIEFILEEIKRVEKKIDNEEVEMDKIRSELIAFRTQHAQA